MEKQDKNEYVQGDRYLIEHRPSKSEPWSVWDMETIFRKDHASFNCHTKADATVLCAKLAALRLGAPTV